MEIDPKDLWVRSYREDSPGGQHTGKCDFSVLITHIPTGITVGSSMERSRHRNELRAMEIMEAKLARIYKCDAQGMCPTCSAIIDLGVDPDLAWCPTCGFYVNPADIYKEASHE